MRLAVTLFFLATNFPALAQPAIPPAFGPHVNPAEKDFAEARSFTAQDRIVGTYYFYWYAAETKEHLLNGNGSDALTDHPATLDDFSYRSVRWHKKELGDMMAAGIDVVLPVFWGAPSEHEAKAHLHWSYAGLQKLVQAREELLREGVNPPRIGLFYDTSTLQHNRWNQHIDLTTDYGHQWFYAAVRDFFSLVPPKHWAMIDGKPIILLYGAGFAKNHDQTFLDHTRAAFARDFAGRVPWIAAEVSWRVKADSKVAWGGALGLRNPGVAALGPGYDHSAVPGRAPLIVKRDGGRFYEENWLKFLRRPSNFVMVETWNEYHEGTDVAESKEYGRQYIELTRKYADLFKQGWKPVWPKGTYSDAKSVSIVLGTQNQERGLRWIDNEDGHTAPATMAGSEGRAIQPGSSPGRFVYFAVDDSFKSVEPLALTLDVEYFDAAPGTLAVEFDGSDPKAPFSGAYSRSLETTTLTGSKTWKNARFTLPGAQLLNSQNRGADLRLALTAPEFLARKLTLRPVDASRRLDWFREAKFGMFIHWGPYSQLGGEWNGRQMQDDRNAEWIMKRLKIPVTEYRELAHKMNPVKFDAREWVRLAKGAGMKYLVITAKHHDGFAMYRSTVSPYNIADWTPFKRDPLQELSQACAEAGVKFCVYYSHREDWDHPGGYGNDWDYDNDWGDDFYDAKRFNAYLEEKAKPQLRELLTRYGPIGLVWFDRGMYTPSQGKDFVNLVRGLQPATLINSRVGHYSQELLGDYQSMADNGMPPGGLEEYWETPMTLNDTWGFRKSDTHWKSPETVIQRLVEIVSRGGNYLLNVGPTGDGEIPAASVEILQKVGLWVKRNAEGLYGTTANPFGELAWGYCTVKANKLYLFVRDWPRDGSLTLPGMENAVSSAHLLLDPVAKVPVTSGAKQIRLTLPAKAPDSPISVVVLELDGAPWVEPPTAAQDAKGTIELDYLTAITHGKAVTRFNRKGGFHISKWAGPEDSVAWRIRVNTPGRFKVSITYSANQEGAGKPFEITLGQTRIEQSTIYTGDWFVYHEFPVGYFEFPKPGEYTLTVRPQCAGSTSGLYLRSITLRPAAGKERSGWGVDR